MSNNPNENSLLDGLVAQVIDNRDICYAPTQYAWVERVVGMLLEAGGIRAPIGTICWLETQHGELPCEIVGFHDRRSFLMALAPTEGIQVGAKIRLPNQVDIGGGRSGNGLAPINAMLGRVIDGLGNPIDGGPEFSQKHPSSALNAINPMHRAPIEKPLDTGIKCINSLLSVGQGQRLGLFAGSGVGKSVLLGMLARFVTANVVVVALIGERGREVQEFVVDNLGTALSRSIVVACPADDSPALRLRGAKLATQIAEKFRDQGKNVLLLMDSLTRVAQAQREIGLAMGEPPTSKGYTPSSFAWLPRLVERAGRGTKAGGGCITGFYTVLMEEDDLQDPVVDAARAILDGHLVLSRALAEQGIYPAIDVAQSVSRLLPRLVDTEHLALISRFRQLWHVYNEQRDLINVGAYRPGVDAILDEAVSRYPSMCEFLQQSSHDSISLEQAQADLRHLFTDATQTSDTNGLVLGLPDNEQSELPALNQSGA